jgi:hypothetical protein
MADIFIEACPKGRPEEVPFEDYVVEEHAQMLAFFQNTTGSD